MVGASGWAGPLFLTLGSAVLVVIFAAIIRQQWALFNVVMGLGALAWFIGNVLWLAGWAIPQIVLWWLGFLIVTIVGERLELSRLLRLTPWRYATFLAALGIFWSGMVVSVWAFDVGGRVGGAGMVALAVWLQHYDIARRTVRKTGLTRFIAVALLAGYVWLFIGGVFALRFGGVMAGPAYDAMLHAVFVGFVISMVFGHAPVIFPAVLRVPLRYDRTCYAPLLLLHLSLLMRLGGDVLGASMLRRSGGLLNAVALLLFLLNTVRLVRRGAQTSSRVSNPAASVQPPQNVPRTLR